MAIKLTIPSDNDLQEHVERIDEKIIHSPVLPPAVLILHRRAIRAYPDGSMVIQYYSDVLGTTIAVPLNPTGYPVIGS